jgi:carboxypeptidase PM20D1
LLVGDAGIGPRARATRATAHLAEAVRFRTISWQDGAPAKSIAASQAAFVAFRDWIAAYPAFSAAATREIVGGYSLLFTWAGTDPSAKPVLLMSHKDVVPVAPGSETDWTHDPFAGDVAGGFVWGRGTMDVKNGIVGMLEAAEALAQTGFRPKRTTFRFVPNVVGPGAASKHPEKCRLLPGQSFDRNPQYRDPRHRAPLLASFKRA